MSTLKTNANNFYCGSFSSYYNATQSISSQGKYILARIELTASWKSSPCSILGSITTGYSYTQPVGISFLITGGYYTNKPQVKILSYDKASSSAPDVFSHLYIEEISETEFLLVGYYRSNYTNWIYVSFQNLQPVNWNIVSIPLTADTGEGTIVSTTSVANTPNGLTYYGSTAPTDSTYCREGTIFYKIL